MWLSFILAPLFLVLVGLVPLWQRSAQRSRLRHTPTTPAAEVRPSARVKVVGRLTVRRPVRAPFSDKPCAWYRLSVTQRDSEDEARERAPLRHEEVEYAEGWAVEDASGRLAIEPADALLVGTQVREYAPGSAFNSFEPPHEVLSRYVTWSQEGTRQHTSFREERLDVGVPLTVVGRVEEGPRGLVLTGGLSLEIYEGFERENLQYRPADYLFALMVVGGLALSGAAVVGMLQEPPPPPPAELSPVTPLRPPPGDTPRPP